MSSISPPMNLLGGALGQDKKRDREGETERERERERERQRERDRDIDKLTKSTLPLHYHRKRENL